MVRGKHYHIIIEHWKEINQDNESQAGLPSAPKQKGQVPPALSQKEAVSVTIWKYWGIFENNGASLGLWC